MTSFEDQLFADLMEEYRPALQRLDRPAASAGTRRVPARRAAWLTGVATAGGAAAAGVLLLSGSTPAYAVTQHPNGTVTVSITKPTGVQPANAKLRVLGDPVVLVPVGRDCPTITSLPKGRIAPAGTIRGVVSDIGGAITVNVHGIPAGDIMIIAARTQPDGMQLIGALTSGPAPRCISLPSPPAPLPRAPLPAASRS
jgi:hypothetical protein